MIFRERHAILLTLLLVPVFLLGCFWQASAATENLAKDMSYTYNVQPDASYADGDGELTNGKYGEAFAWGEEKQGPHKDAAWAATKEQSWVITVDLTTLRTIDQIKVNFLKFGGAAIRHPKQIVAAVSVNGTDWSHVGSQDFIHASMPQGATMTTFYVRGIEARYVRLTIEKEGQWTFIDEIEVLSGAAQ